jgi:WD40 repeat protein
MDRRRARALEGGAGPFAALAFAPDGHHVAAGGPGGVAIWTIASGAGRVLGDDPVTALAFTADGKTLVAAGADRALAVWDVASGAVRRHDVGGVACLAVRGQTAATCGPEGVRLTDLGSGQGRLLAAGPARAAVFVDGGVATAGADGTLRVWPDDLPTTPAALRDVIARSCDADVGKF